MNGLFAIVPFAWIGLFIAFGVWRRVQSGKPVAPRVPPGAAFGETGCSGRILGGVMQRMGGASNCLVVVVDRGRFSVRLAFPFSVLPMPGLGRYEFDVPIATIARVTAQRRMWQNILRIDFTTPDRAPIELTLRNEAGLVAALGTAATVDRTDRALRAKTGMRLRTWFTRGFMCLWGTVVLAVSGSGLIDALALRANGQATTGVVLNLVGKIAMVRYRVDGSDYTLPSRFSGNWKPGQTETIFYLRNDPSQASEDGTAQVDAIGMMIGLLVLILGLFGPRLIPGWA
jgi:hypothetical protein